MFRTMRFSIFIGLIMALLAGMSAAVLASEDQLGLETVEARALTQRLDELAADIDEDTAKSLGFIFYELSQLLEPDDLRTILQLLFVRMEPTHDAASYPTVEPEVFTRDTQQTALIGVEILPMPEHLQSHLVDQVANSRMIPQGHRVPEHSTSGVIEEWTYPLLPYLLTEQVSAVNLSPRQAMTQAASRRQAPIAQHVSARADIPSLIQQLNIALQNPTLEWRLPDGTRLQPRIIIELVPVVERDTGQGSVRALPAQRVVLEEVQFGD